LATLQVEEVKAELICGRVVDANLPAALRELFQELEAAVDDSALRHASSIGEQIDAWDWYALSEEEQGSHDVRDVQIYADGGASFRMRH
jgi:hypothetical protein